MKVAVPERLGRRMSVGPFTDPRDFLRFLIFASAGAIVALCIGILWGAVIAALGAVLTLARMHDEAVLTLLLRRASYRLLPRNRSPMVGRETPQGWRDRWGRRWRFCTRDPLPIYGKAPDLLHEEALHLVRLVSAVELETVLIRSAVPWSVDHHLPAGLPEERVMIAGYRRLLEQSIEGRYRSRIVIGVCGRRGECSEAVASLSQEGWRELRGGELLATLRHAFPYLVRAPVLSGEPRRRLG